MQHAFVVRFLLALFAFLWLVSPVMAAEPDPPGNPPIGWLTGRSGLAPFDADYFTLSVNSTLTNERVLTFSTPQFAVSDNGAGNTYVVGLGPILSYWYSTGATTNQQALNAITNIAGRATGDIFYWNGTNFTRLPIGSVSDVLTVSAGLPAWVSPASGAPQGAHYVTTQTDGTLTNEHVLGNGDGTTANVGAGTAVVDVDSTVIRTTGAQSMAGPKTLSGGPIVSGANSTGLVLRGSANDSTILTDPGANQNVTIPSVGNSSFVMTAGNQTIGGVKTLSSSPVLSTDALTGSGGNTITFPTSSQTLLGRTTNDTVTNKEFTSPAFTNNATGMTLKGSGSNTFVVDWAPGATGQTLSLPDPNGNVDLAYKTGAAAAGGFAYGIGNNTLSITGAGTTGQVPVSAGASAPAWGVAPIAGGGTNNGSLGVSALGIYNGDGSKVVQTTGTAGQSWRVNAGGTAVEAYTPGPGTGTVTSFSATPSGIFDVATTTSTPALSLDNQNANTFLSGPASGSATTPAFRVLAIGDYVAFPVCNGGRLTLTSGSSVADATSAGTIYWTPHKHGVISLWDGSKYVNVLPGEKSLSLTLTSGNVYDVWGYLSGGTLALETLAWTDTTTRATAIAVDASGITYKSGDATRRFLGTIYASGTNQCTDNTGLRGLFNQDNQEDRLLYSSDSTDSWTYNTASVREINAGSVNGVSRIGVLAGNTTTAVDLKAQTRFLNATATLLTCAIGLDSSTTIGPTSVAGTTSSAAGFNSVTIAQYTGIPGLGLHSLRQLEVVAPVATATTIYGDAGGAYFTTGMRGIVRM